MKTKENGVRFYTRGTACIPVHFPEDQTVCAQCPFVTRKYGLRWECLLTLEQLLYPSDSRGNRCPVMFEENEDLQQEG